MFLIFLLVFACVLWPEVTSFSFWIVVSLIVMAFQGAGQAKQLTPAGVEPVPAFLEKSFVDFSPTYDKTYGGGVFCQSSSCLDLAFSFLV